MGFMADNAYRFPGSGTKGKIKEALYLEMWYFDLHDEKEGIEMSINCCIDNPSNSWFGRKLGFPATSDLLTLLSIESAGIRRANIDNFFPKFEADETCLKVNIGDVVFFEAIDDHNIHLYGKDESVGLSFNLVFTQAITEIEPIKTIISKRKDFLWYQSKMPHAHVKGTVKVDENFYEVDCQGYHDHDWGSPTKLAWSPWSVAAIDDFGILTYTCANIGFVLVFHDGKWMKFPMPRVSITERKKTEIKGKGGETLEFDRPVSIDIESELDGYRIAYTIKEWNDKFYALDVGWQLMKKIVHSPSIMAVNYKTSGAFFKDGKVLREFKDLNSSYQYFEGMDYFKLL